MYVQRLSNKSIVFKSLLLLEGGETVGEVVGEKKEFTLFPQAYPLIIPTTNP